MGKRDGGGNLAADESIIVGVDPYPEPNDFSGIDHSQCPVASETRPDQMGRSLRTFLKRRLGCELFLTHSLYAFTA